MSARTVTVTARDMRGGPLGHRTGRPLTVAGVIPAVVHRDVIGHYVVSCMRSGAKIASGRTQREAIENAEASASIYDVDNLAKAVAAAVAKAERWDAESARNAERELVDAPLP